MGDGMNEGLAIKTNLYRHFDADGKLLYVGISLSAISRLGQHQDHSHWFGSIARVEIVSFPSRADAIAAEREAIKNEKPLHNIVHRRVEAAPNSKYEAARAELVHQTVRFKPLYNRREAADAIGVASSAISSLIQKGKIGFVEINDRKFITGWQLIDFIESCDAMAKAKKSA